MTGSETYIEAVARAIASEGTEHVFGLMGAGTIRLTHHLTVHHGIGYHSSRHENGAIGAADGFARVKGLGVAVVSNGPALLNSMTALTTAARGSTPMVVIACDSPSLTKREHPFLTVTQGIDVAAVTAALDLPVIRVEPDSPFADTGRAFAEARRRRGPVLLLLDAGYETTPVARTDARPDRADTAGTAPRPADVASVAELLRQAQRPVLLAGIGAWHAGAGATLEQLADQVGAVLATTLRGVGTFREHPYSVGVCGGFAPPAIAALLREADCVIAFGASLNYFTTIKGSAFPEATVVQCDEDASAFGRYVPIDKTVHADARAFAEALLAVVETDGEAPKRSPIREAFDALAPAARRFAFPDVSTSGALDPRAVCRTLDRILPAERTIVSDSGQLCEYPIESMEFWAPDGLLWMMDFGSVGSGLGPAIGAAVAAPDRPTVLFIGDGGLFMTLGDLDLVARDEIPLLVVCMNDRAYGAEIAHMREMDVPNDLARFETPDLSQVARSLGLEAVRITELEQIDALSDQIRQLKRPLFLDCMLITELVDTPIRQHV